MREGEPPRWVLRPRDLLGERRRDARRRVGEVGLHDAHEAAEGDRRARLAGSLRSAGAYLDGLFEYLVHSLQSMPPVIVLGAAESRIPVLSFAVTNVPAERVAQRLANNGILAMSNAGSRVLDLIGVDDIGGAVTVGLAHYTTTYEVDQLMRALASLG